MLGHRRRPSFAGSRCANLYNLTSDSARDCIRGTALRSIQNKEYQKMSLDDLLAAALMNADESLNKRHARRGNKTTREFMLEDIKADIRAVTDDLGLQDQEFRTAVILLAAALIVGPHVDLLVQFTRYSRMFVAAIARRMRANGLWGEDEVLAMYWFGDDKHKRMFLMHCLVAQGVMQVQGIEDGEMLFVNVESKPN
jgi:hypothetical protein